MRKVGRTSISMRHAQFKDGEIILKTHIFVNLEIFKVMIAFLLFLTDMEENSAQSSAKRT